MDNFHEYNSGYRRGLSFMQIIALVIVASLIGGVSIGAGYQVAGLILGGNAPGDQLENQSSLDEREETEGKTPISHNVEQLGVEEIVEKVGPSIVSITSKIQTRDFFSRINTQEGLGSGVIFEINDDGIMILTNNHVIENAHALTVTFKDELQADAKVIGSDSDTDLAILQIDRKDIPQGIQDEIKVAEFGDSDRLKVGERAIAIGNPLGYSDTVTVGVISALDRELQVADKNLKLIQTDAAINPGNSGGALVNGSGQLVGINTVKIADTQVEGIGFAIPINYAKPIIEELLEQGYVSRPYLGIVAGDVDEETADLYKLPVGVLIYDVMDGSAADKAGLIRGDVIIEINGDKILTMEQLTGIIADSKVGDSIHVIAVR